MLNIITYGGLIITSNITINQRKKIYCISDYQLSQGTGYEQSHPKSTKDMVYCKTQLSKPLPSYANMPTLHSQNLWLFMPVSSSQWNCSLRAWSDIKLYWCNIARFWNYGHKKKDFQRCYKNKLKQISNQIAKIPRKVSLTYCEPRLLLGHKNLTVKSPFQLIWFLLWAIALKKLLHCSFLTK